MLIYLDDEMANELILAIKYFKPMSFNEPALVNIINQINKLRSENYEGKSII